ncbi:MAG: hypothetical protein Ct9H90mP14_0490 [Methanobacteriota archaeon]|nr:MAG: hypothetical protein Ct9H90mP14_0490 [Euryarchaeota archaeon]
MRLAGAHFPSFAESVGHFVVALLAAFVVAGLFGQNF